MIDPIALLTVMAGQTAMAAALACLAWAGLRAVYAGSATARHAVASACFYGAALWPLAALLPQHLTVTIGPEEIPVLDASAFMLGNLALGSTVYSICIALLVIAGAGALIRFGFTLRAVVHGETLAQNASPALHRYGLPDGVRIGISEAVKGPALVGVFTPTILFPRRLEHAPEMPALLLHELAHLRRGDLCAAFRQRIIEDVCWWNWPLHRLGRWLAEQREMSCDEWAAERDDAYAMALAGEARARLAPPPLAAGIGGAPIERRLERLAEPPRRPLALIAALIAFSVLAGAVAAPRLDRGSATHIGIASS